MDIVQIIIRYNPAWTKREIIFFLFIWLFAAYILWKRLKHGKATIVQMIFSLLLLAYIAVVYASCVFTRMPTGMHQAEFELFWSWKLVFQGSREMLKENLLNMVLLFPAGFLLPLTVSRKHRKNGTLPIWIVVIFGIAVSAGIESLQYILERGLFELDDIIHNTLGCLAGGLFMNLILLVYNHHHKKQKGKCICLPD